MPLFRCHHSPFFRKTDFGINLYALFRVDDVGFNKVFFLPQCLFRVMNGVFSNSDCLAPHYRVRILLEWQPSDNAH